MNQATKEYDALKHHTLYEKITDLKRLNFVVTNLGSDQPIAATKILDVGCGNGHISMYLGEMGYQVSGVDVSEDTIEKAQKLNHLDNVSFSVVDAENIQLPARQYDAIVCSEVLEHLDHPSVLLETLHQALKDDGKLIVTVPNGVGPREVLVTKPILALRRQNGWTWRSVSRIKRTLGYDGTTVQSEADNLDHVQFFSKKDLESLARNNHFTIVKFQNVNFVEDVFPISLLSRRVKAIQRLDCKVADWLPHNYSGGFLTVWKKSVTN